MRIEKAKKLLEKAELIISDVASDSGFNDTSSFIKQFKKITGMTPAGYRKSLI
jgi:AraC-like DNA-binding protein